MNRFLRVLQAALTEVALGTLLISSAGNGIYRKDLQADYLPALALRNGVNVFTRLTELSERYFPVTVPIFPHPTPHPPVLVLLSLPLTLLPYPVVVLLWLAANVFLLTRVGKWLGFSVQQSLVIAAWPPMWELLNVGNFELVVLTLAMLGWKSAAMGRDRRAGVWLGLAAVIKLYPVLFLVPFVMRRRWRLVGTAGVTVVLSQVGNLAVVGLPGVVGYYMEVLPAVSASYVHSDLNSSPYGALLRVLGGNADLGIPTYTLGPAMLLAVATALFGLAALTKVEAEAAPLGALFVLPNVWSTYAVLALPQVTHLLRCRISRHAALVVCAAASVTYPLVNLLLGSCSNAGQAAALLAIQPLGFLGLLLLSIVNRVPATHAGRHWLIDPEPFN